MKIFDYTNSKKGEILGHSSWTGCGCRIGKLNGYLVKSCWYDKNNKVCYADDFGVDLVLMCTGKWGTPNSDDAEKVWDWQVVPSRAITEKAIARNQNLYGTPYYQGA